MAHDGWATGLADVLGAVAGIDRAAVTPAASFTDDLGIDSLAMVEVVVAAEDRFGVLIPDEDWSRFRTVGDAIEYLDRLTAPPWNPRSGG